VGRSRTLNRVVQKSGGLALPRVVLQYKLSDAVLAGGAEPRDFLVGERTLGKAFVAHVGPWRPHAVRLVRREVDAESFDEHSPIFLEIAEEAKHRRRSEERTARVSVEFLLWLPRARTFALFEFTNFAARNADTARVRTGGLALLTTELVGTSGWFIPVCQDAPSGRYRALPDRRHQAALEVFATNRPETAQRVSGPGSTQTQGERLVDPQRGVP